MNCDWWWWRALARQRAVVALLVRWCGVVDTYEYLEPSPDRPFAVRGLDSHQRRIRPRRFADRETALHVAQLLRAVGYSVSVTWCLGETTVPWCLGGTTTTSGARRV